MACPFGFGRQDMNGDEEVDDEQEEEQEEGADESSPESVECRPPGQRSQRAMHQQDEDGDEDEAPAKFDTDPLAWFKANNIANEQDFEQKRTQLQQEAMRRLNALKLAKKKLLEFDSDLDEESLDDAFSDMDTDAHSLSSFASHAEHWLYKSKYQLKAEPYMKYAAPAALAVAMVCIFQSYGVWALCTRVGGVVINTNWPIGCFSMSLIAALFVALAYMSTVFRSKRMLLSCLVGLVLVYSAAVALLALMHAKPTSLDEKLFKAACMRSEKTEIGSRLCSLMPTIRRDISEALPPFMSSVVAVAGCSFALVVLGIWYMFEMAHVEKKSTKQKRRDKRTKHTIPWDKIKVSAAATTAKWVESGGAVAAGGGDSAVDASAEPVQTPAQPAASAVTGSARKRAGKGKAA